MNRLRFSHLYLLLPLFVLTVYYPSYWNPPSVIDDFTLLQTVELREGLDWGTLFLPRSNFYYRPLIALSFHWDQVVWNLTPSMMLLENVLLHCGNVLLLLLIARKTGLPAGLAAAAAIFFAAHPLATESLNWISGRTDPQAVFFHLAAAFFLIRAIETSRLLPLLPALACTFAGIASKEMSGVFLVANSLLVCIVPATDVTMRTRLKTVFFYCLPFVAGILIYIVARSLAFGDSTRHVPVLSEMPFLEILRQSLTALGFYLKKIIVPTPLNFAIHEIHAAYLYAGSLSLVLLGAAFFFCRDKKAPLLFAGVPALLAPAVALGLTHAAWTPYAERYAYQALPFFSLAVAALVASFSDIFFSRWRNILLCMASLLAAVLVWTTWQRNLQWQNSTALFEEAVRLSPRFATVRNALAVSYFREKRTAEALFHLREGIRLDGMAPSHRNQILYANLASQYIGAGTIEKAEQVISLAFTRSNNNPSSEVLIEHGKILQVQAERLPQQERLPLLQKSIAVYQLLFDKTRDPFYLYQAGKVSIQTGDPDRAHVFFTRVAEIAPDSSPYKKAAKALMKRTQ